MTNEEKAKAYDEAIKKAKEIKEKIVYSHLSTESCKAVSEYIDTIIPELRESEDEKIRKGMIRFLESEQAEGMFTYEARQSWIAYLEKQKEQKPAEWSEKHIADVFEKVGLAKIVREQANDALTNAVQSAMIELSKVGNAEWSEEDEEMRLEAIRVLVSGCERYRKESGCLPGWHKVINWLKDLRPQPKQEWSEDDIDKMVKKRARATGTTKSEMDFYRNGIKDAIKQFGLHPSWKPSEEQMEALKSFLDYHRPIRNGSVQNWQEFDNLESLYNDLKKL